MTAPKRARPECTLSAKSATTDTADAFGVPRGKASDEVRELSKRSLVMRRLGGYVAGLLLVAAITAIYRKTFRKRDDGRIHIPAGDFNRRRACWDMELPF
jgi:hypothetical protein